MVPSLRIIPRSAPFFIRFLGAIGVIIVIAIVAWWYYGRQAAMVDEIFREASSSLQLQGARSAVSGDVSQMIPGAAKDV